MIDMTPDAKQRFDAYLQRTRTALRGTRAVEPAEVEQNVIEHVELALAGVPSPVGSDSLRSVLEKLGPPERWLPEEEQPVWRRIYNRIMDGPDDWRLAYASFAMTVLMVIFLPVGGPILLPLAFLLSRAYVQLLQERGERLGARGWLVLPPIVIGFLFFIGTVLAIGIAPVAVIAGEGALREWGFEPDDRSERIRMYAGLVTAAAGVWWILLAGALAALFRPIRWLFAPILDRAKRGWLWVLCGLGVVCAVVGSILLWA